MSATATKSEKKAPAFTPGVGDLVYAVFWREFPVPGQPKNGTWDTQYGQVISVGTNGVVCYETASRSNGEGSLTGSFLRFARLADTYPTLDAATEAARSRPPKN